MARERKKSKDGSVHVTDERVNTITHLMGAILSFAGGVFLVVQSSVAGKPWHIVGFSIYGLCLFLLFLASTLHHGIESLRRIEERLRTLDYSAVFLLIGGTFTPICFIVARGPIGWSVFGITWIVSIVYIDKGIKSTAPKKARTCSNDKSA